MHKNPEFDQEYTMSLATFENNEERINREVSLGYTLLIFLVMICPPLFFLMFLYNDD